MIFGRLYIVLFMAGPAFAQGLPTPPSTPETAADCARFLDEGRASLNTARIAAFERAASAYGGEPYYPDPTIILEAELMFESSLTLADAIYMADRRCHRKVTAGAGTRSRNAVFDAFVLSDADERESSVDRGRRASLLVTGIVGSELIAIKRRLAVAEDEISGLRGDQRTAAGLPDRLDLTYRRWRRGFDRSVDNTRPVPDDGLSQMMRDIASVQP